MSSNISMNIKRPYQIALNDVKLNDFYLNSSDAKIMSPHTAISSPKTMFFKDRVQKKKKNLVFRGQS